MWLWVLATGIFLISSLILFLLYRQARLSLLEHSYQTGAMPPIDEVAALLQELRDAGEIIIDRIEVKKQEADALLKLLDAKIETVELALQTHERTQFSGQKHGGQHEVNQFRPQDKHEIIKKLSSEGLDPLAITQKTGWKLDEVRLIINLQTTQSK